MAVSDYIFFERWASGYRIVVQMNSGADLYKDGPWVCYNEYAHVDDADISYELAWSKLGLDDEWRFEDWNRLHIEEGQVWSSDKFGLELTLMNMDEEHVYTKDSDGTYGKLEIKWFFHCYKLASDDDPSYTDGFRSGYTGLRWL